MSFKNSSSSGLVVTLCISFLYHALKIQNFIVLSYVKPAVMV